MCHGPTSREREFESEKLDVHSKHGTSFVELGTLAWLTRTHSRT